ncbi:WPP domain containing protein [Parasponia andersonii]|uniref:WPP domain containing protein n=1 Tax=Parasponia andersonii TaxID=3476 RepID=A0A2P5BJB8_PARAD|nr:WPP domain containing protein [Parasponia andersonii]
MSEQESATVTPPPASHSHSEQDSSTMESPPKEEATPATNNKPPTRLSFSLWPPAQHTREAVVTRLIETLSTPSVLSNRYGTIPEDEASANARLIEEEAYSAAVGSAAAEDDGIQVLQVYSKEISKRMLDVVKARAADSGSAPPADGGASQQPVAFGSVDPKVENEESSS